MKTWSPTFIPWSTLILCLAFWLGQPVALQGAPGADAQITDIRIEGEVVVLTVAVPDGLVGAAVLALELDDQSTYAARIANSVNITAVGVALTPAANGTLGIASFDDLVVAYSDEIFNNTTGATALLRIRPAGSASYLAASDPG